jgi:hypothetical protein
MMNKHAPERFAALSKALNDASDLLTSEIVNVESALNDLRLGLEVWIEVSRGKEIFTTTDSKEESALTRVLWLGYAKYSGRWGLFTEETLDEVEPDDVRYLVALRDAKREVRLVAADKIPILVEKIQRDAEKTAQETIDKAAKLKDFAASLRKKAR